MCPLRRRMQSLRLPLVRLLFWEGAGSRKLAYVRRQAARWPLMRRQHDSQRSCYREPDMTAGNKLASQMPYKETFGIPFKQKGDGYLHTEAPEGVKSFALWRSLRRCSRVLARILGPTRSLSRNLGLRSRSCRPIGSDGEQGENAGYNKNPDKNWSEPIAKKIGRSVTSASVPLIG
jgi:hypothetical protein